MTMDSAFDQSARTSPVDFFLPRFQRRTIQTSGVTINVLVGGDGPPLRFYTGIHANACGVAQDRSGLAKSYTLVIPDLRGYGDSGKPADGKNHVNYSKRAMALDQVEVMEKLGFRQFAMVCHDRGARGRPIVWRSTIQIDSPNW